MPKVTFEFERTGNSVSREGTTAISLMGTREGEGLATVFDMELGSAEEGATLVGAFLAQLETLKGPNFVSSALNQYAEMTGKVLKQTQNREITLVRGHRGNAKRKP